MGEVEWQIALALADGAKHGYAILLEIEAREGERGRVLPGSLYRALHRLERGGLVEEVDVDADDERRRVFALTARGRRAAEREVERLAAALRAARRKGLVAERGRA
jgi:DNA-binding PadR family transcriptional regulator